MLNRVWNCSTEGLLSSCPLSRGNIIFEADSGVGDGEKSSAPSVEPIGVVTFVVSSIQSIVWADSDSVVMNNKKRRRK